MPEWFDELAGLVRIPSISADPAHAGDVRRAGEWVCDFIASGGGQTELIDWSGRPLAVGRLRASRDAAAAPTVLCYGHFDVQPPEPLELWESDPFEPEVRGEHLYGRGVADDKGQLYLLLRAARDLAATGELPVNVRFACDGEEETGGDSILQYLAADDQVADAAVIFDSGMIARDRPAFSLATRGIVYLHVTLRTGERDLHSGMYGGAALNAAQALAQALDALRSREGRLAEPLRAGASPPTGEEVESWRGLPLGEQQLAEQGARPLDDRAAEEFYLRTFAEPSLDVNGIRSGSPDLQKTVIPVEAVANMSLRVAPGQDAEALGRVLERLLREAAPPGAELEVLRLGAAQPGLVDPRSPAVRLGLTAFERALGVRPLLVRSGGTLPIVPALTARGVATILTGFALPDSNIHSPNERLLAEYIPRGIETARALLQELGGL